jgi:hypothetical protein
MKRLILAACLLAPPALAQTAEKTYPTIELPSDLVMRLRQYLGGRPYDEVQFAVEMISDCVAIQIPKNGVIRDNGQCPAVSAAIRARAAVPTAAPAAGTNVTTTAPAPVTPPAK